VSLGSVFKKEAWAETRTQVVHAGVQFLWPLGVTAMTFLSGVIGGAPVVPWPYLLTATGLMFMATSTGAYYFSQFVYQQNPEGKFQVKSPSLVKRYGSQQKLVSLKYQFIYENKAIFPIRFDVTPYHVSLGASFNPKPQRDVTGSIALGGALGFFTEAEIPTTDSMRGQLVEGKWEFKIGYGKPNKRQYSAIQKWRTYVKFNDDGDVEGFEATDVS
jgi:hypothetical protein